MPQRRLVVMLIAVLSLAGLAPVAPAAAVQEEEADITLTDDVLPVVDGAEQMSAGMLVWPEGRRAYQLAFSPKNNLLPDQIAAVDLDTLREVDRVDTASLASSVPGGFYFPRKPLPTYATLDPDGRIFAFYSPRDRSTCGTAYCIRGVYALDATTLDPLGAFPLSAEMGAVPGRGALTYAAGKLYVLLSELGDDGLVKDVRDRGNIARLAQMDATTGTTDWVVRVDACTADPASTVDTVGHYGVLHTLDASGSPSVYVGCHGSGRATRIVQIPLDDEGAPGPQVAYPGPRFVDEIRGDATSGRMLLKSDDGGKTSWWVFDSRESAFVGVIGVGPYSATQTTGAVDPATGRLYMLAPPKTNPTADGGLLVADIRRTPLPQGQPSTELAPLAATSAGPMAVESAGPDRPRRLFVYRVKEGTNRPYWHVVSDRRAISTDLPRDDPDARTVDVPEADGITSASYLGTTRGYGLRTLLVGGLEALARDPSADTSLVFQNFLVSEPEGPCGPRDRELVLGSAGPAKLSDQSADAQSQAAFVDPVLDEDASRPASRCGSLDVDQEPPLEVRFAPSDCVSPDPDPARTASSTAHPLLLGFSSTVRCGDEVTGAGRAVAVDGLGPVSIASASSTVKLVRDPARGLVATVVSEVRGIDIGGMVQIDSIRTVAESWANGRRQAESAAPQSGCDRTRSAGTCLERAISGVTAGTFRCGTGKPCGDEAALVEGLRRALGNSWQVRIRKADADLAKGSPGGYRAAVQKPAAELFSDGVLNNDSLPTLPALELIHFADGQKGRGRQIYQFAGAEIATTYGIELLPQDPPPPPAALRIQLADGEGEALAGGIFRVYTDADADGAVGLRDEPVEGGTCVTTADGSGDCSFDELMPGLYVVQQVAAPPGYQISPDVAISLESASRTTIDFTNLRAVGRIEIAITDDASPAMPLAGAEFTVLGDDGDGIRSDGDRPYATCTTDAGGECAFDDVPLGAYVVHQTVAPADHLTGGDAAFTLAHPGETARVTFVTGLEGMSGTPGESGTEGTLEGEDDLLADGGEESTVEVIIEEAPPRPLPLVTVEPISEVSPASGQSLGRRLLRAPAAVGRYLARSPGEALLFGTVFLLFGGAVVLVLRRRSLAAVATIGVERPLFGPGAYHEVTAPRPPQEAGDGGVRHG